MHPRLACSITAVKGIGSLQHWRDYLNCQTPGYKRDRERSECLIGMASKRVMDQWSWYLSRSIKQLWGKWEQAQTSQLEYSADGRADDMVWDEPLGLEYFQLPDSVLNPDLCITSAFEIVWHDGGLEMERGKTTQAIFRAISNWWVIRNLVAKDRAGGRASKEPELVLRGGNNRLLMWPIFSFFKCVSVFLFYFVASLCVCCLWRPEKASGPLELEIQVVVSCRVGAEKGMGPMEELHVLLTNELSLWAHSLKCFDSACVQYFSFLYPYTLAEILPLKLSLVLPIPCSKITKHFFLLKNKNWEPSSDIWGFVSAQFPHLSWFQHTQVVTNTHFLQVFHSHIMWS